MAGCPTCGAAIAEGETLCVQCAARSAAPNKREQRGQGAGPHVFDDICAECGAFLPQGRGVCLVCKAPRREEVCVGKFPAEAEAAPYIKPARAVNCAARKTPDLWRRWSSAVAGSILMALLVFGGYRIYVAYFDTSSYRARESVLYEAGETLLLSRPGFERPKPVAGIERPPGGYGGGRIRASKNGRWMAYASPSGALYLVDLAQRGDGDLASLEAVRLADGLALSEEFLLGDEYLVYLTEKRELYASNMVDVWKLDASVEAVVAMEESRVLYTRRGDEPGQLDLYLDYLPRGGGDLQVIDRNVGEVLDWTRGFEKLMYTVVRKDERGAQTRYLQQFERGENLDKSTVSTLAVGMGEVIDASAQTGTAVFMAPQAQKWSYEEFIEDDYALRDALMEKPDIADDPVLQRALARFDSEAEFLENMQNDETVLGAYTRYRDAQRQWEDKQERDRLRTRYRQLFSGLAGRAVLNDLYVYRNGETAMLDSGVMGAGAPLEESLADADRGFAIYQKADPQTIRPAKLSDIWKTAADAFDPLTYYYDKAYSELCYAAFGAAPSRLYIPSENSTYKQWMAAAGEGGVYFTIGAPEKTGADALYYAPVKNGEVSPATLVQRGVTGISAGLRDGVLFEARGGSGQALYFVQMGKARLLATGEPVQKTVAGGGNTLIYYKEAVSEGGGGRLCMFVREESVLADGVTGYGYRSDALVYLLKQGADSASTDLYVWQNGKERLVDENVRVVPDYNEDHAF